MREKEKSLEIINRIAGLVKHRGGQVYIVGGYIRDSLLKREPTDIDVRIVGISKKDFIDILKKVAKEYNTRYEMFGERFEIMQLKGFDIDFASPEDKEGRIRSHADIFRDLDFTINAVGKRVGKKHNNRNYFEDPYNGIKDLSAKCIRIATPEIEDQSLALRAAKLKAKLACKFDAEGNIIWGEIDDSWEIDTPSRDLMLRNDYDQIKPGRIRSLLEKVINNPQYVQSVFYRELLNLGVLKKLLAPLWQLSEKQVDVNGNEMTAFEHTIRMLDYLMQFRSEFKAENFEQTKTAKEKFEGLYMMCLTYHFRELFRGNEQIKAEIKAFLSRIMTLKKTKTIVAYCVNHENVLVGTYKNASNISDEELAKLYSTHREKLENIGYFVECYNMAGIDNLTLEQREESKKRLSDWKERIRIAKEMSMRTVIPPRLPGETHRWHVAKLNVGFILDDLDFSCVELPRDFEHYFGGVESLRKRGNRLGPRRDFNSGGGFCNR